MSKRTFLSLLMFCLLMLGVGCTPTPVATVPAQSLAPQESAQSLLTQEPAPAVTEKALDTLQSGNRAFAFDLYRTLAKEEGNLFFSPYSISMALAMTYAGARGSTAEQMAATLHYDLPSEELHPAFNALDQSLSASAADDDFIFTVANSLWAQQDYALLDTFLDALALNYAAGVRLVDFKQDAPREQARLAINDWVSDATEEKIEELFVPGVLIADTRLVLANAVYFNAQWERPFLDGTRDGDFALLDGSSVQVPMMSRRANTLYAAAEGIQAADIAYLGERMRMLVLLPDAGTFADFEQTLDAARVRSISEALQEQDLQLRMPKFQYAAELSLAETLAAMGMPAAFDFMQADFSGMDGTRDLLISDVVHKGFVAVDEQGTEAAAATGVVMGVESMPMMMQVDRPFIFVIHDVESGAILFVGRLLDPS